MLQWMGGSRRKVTTSRKSTQKRQKQYFEQRKRQHEQQAARQESCSDTSNSCSRPQLNTHSLDILNFQDLSSVFQEQRPNCPRVESLEGDCFTLNGHTTPHPQTMQSTEVTSVHLESKHTSTSGASSDYQLKTVYPERELMISPGSHNEDLTAVDKSGHLKMINDHQLSVLDLLGDDEPNCNIKGSLGHESHVAFSVQGLGKIGSETPVQSPQQSSRYIAYGCSSPSKVTKQAPPLFKNLTSRLEDLAPEVDGFMDYNDTPLYENEFPVSSRGSVDYFSYTKQKKSVGNGFLQFDDSDPNLRNFFANEDIFNGEDEIECTESSTPDDDFLYDSKCHVSWKNWPGQMDSNSTEYSDFGNCVKEDAVFEGLNAQNNRAFTKATKIFNALDSSTPNCYNQTLEGHHDYTTTEGEWYPPFGRTSGVKPISSKPAWSCFVANDARESLILMSEESCSSSAAWFDAVEDQPLNSVGKKIRTYGSDCGSPTSKGGAKSMYTQETYCPKQENLQLRENAIGPEKGAQMSSPITTSFQKVMDPGKSWLFEDGETTHKTNSGFGSSFQTSTAKERWSLGSQLPDEDLFNVHDLPELHSDAKLCSARLKSDVPEKHSPCGNTFSEKMASEHFNHIYTNESPFNMEFRSRSREPTLSPVNRNFNPHEPFIDLGWQGDADFSGITVKEGGCVDGKKEGIRHACSATIELQEDVCAGSNCLSSENKMKGTTSDAGDICSDLSIKEKDSAPEVMKSLKATSPEHVEEISSVDGLETPDKAVDGHGKEYQNSIQTSLHRNECKEIEVSRPKDRYIEGRMQNKNADPVCQVMMLESYVLHLLCVHVLKEASTQSLEKKEH